MFYTAHTQKKRAFLLLILLEINRSLRVITRGSRPKQQQHTKKKEYAMTPLRPRQSLATLWDAFERAITTRS